MLPDPNLDSRHRSEAVPAVALIKRVRLSGKADPALVIAKLSGSGSMTVVLSGKWLGGGVLIAVDPTRTLVGPSADSEELRCLPKLGDSFEIKDAKAVGGGWLGYLGYQAYDSVPAATDTDSEGLPSMAFGYFDNVLRYDIVEEAWFFESLWTEERSAAIEASKARFAELLDIAESHRSPSGKSQPSNEYSFGPWLVPDATDHCVAVEEARHSIHAGEMLQANVCTQFSADFSGDPKALFVRGVEQFNPDWAAYVGGDWGALVSLSPESFIERDGNDVRSSPIKGTRPRTGDSVVDQALAEDLRNSEKDKSENLMIVDLMRNDLGVVAEAGSVTVPTKLVVEPHPNVWHLVSTVKAKLSPGTTTQDLLRSSFPPGSVTGAPKKQAMTVIARVESYTRHAYTGAAGIISPLQRDEFNVIIRSFEVASGRVVIGTGGGIVSDSDPWSEWNECLAKVVPLIGALDHTQWSGPASEQSDQSTLAVLDTARVDSGVIIDGIAHAERLFASANQESCENLGPPRLWVKGTGEPREVVLRRVFDPATQALTLNEIKPMPSKVGLGQRLASVDLVPTEVNCYRHPLKEADRNLWEGLESCLPTGHLPLIHDQGQVLETSRANLFLIRSGELVVPVDDGRMLPGTVRRRVLLLAREAGIAARFESISLEELDLFDGAFQTSSISGVVRIGEVHGRAKYGSEPHPVAKRLSHDYERWARRDSINALKVDRALDQIRAEYEANKNLRWTDNKHPLVAEAPVLVIDNYDSFSYNLVQALATIGARVEIISNDDSRFVEPEKYSGLVVSPGPLGPNEAGRSMELTETFLDRQIPMLGVCLGHQCLVSVFGGKVVTAPWPRHGRGSIIVHNGAGVFAGLPQSISVARYHSLAADPNELPTGLEITSVAPDDGVIMSIRSDNAPAEGVQFHPESILTPSGLSMLRNFIQG